MERKEVGRRVFISLWNANTNNDGKEIWVKIEDVIEDINKNSTISFSREQIVDAIENDPFRQTDFYGNETNIPIFDTAHTNDKLTSVKLPQLAYENHQQWGLD